MKSPKKTKAGKPKGTVKAARKYIKKNSKRILANSAATSKKVKAQMKKLKK